MSKTVKVDVEQDSVIVPVILVRMATAAMENAYAPYSKFKVGAALLCDDGSIYTGCNIENAAYGPTNCAERTAFFSAINEGKRKFRSIAIVGGMLGKIDNVCPPCGVCRQVMNEFCDPEFKVYLGKSNGYEEYTLGELLPVSFSIVK